MTRAADTHRTLPDAQQDGVKAAIAPGKLNDIALTVAADALN